MKNFLTTKDSIDEIKEKGGGKAYNLQNLNSTSATVPNFIVVSKEVLNRYTENLVYDTTMSVEDNSKRLQKEILSINLDAHFQDELEEVLSNGSLLDSFLAVRSSGIDEDSKDNSFAGMFSSFLFQKGVVAITNSIKECWASAFSVRCLSYRIKSGLGVDQVEVGVVIQEMINSEVSGVTFSRNPNNAIDRKNIYVEAVLGQCEGLVGGYLGADSYLINHKSDDIKITLADKEEMFIQKSTGGIEKIATPNDQIRCQTLNESQLKEMKSLTIELETKFSMPVDIEWAIENKKLYIVQMRPITSLPPLEFYQSNINGEKAILWDNSNIVESFSGVTTPLTFSLTKDAYAVVYRETCRLLHVPEDIIKKYDDAFENMLGFVRGNVYYNLINWYRLLLLLPGFSSNQSFMETMMGVKDELKNDQKDIFDFTGEIPSYSLFMKVKVLSTFTIGFFRIDKIVSEFMQHFDRHYQDYLNIDFDKLSLGELKEKYLDWEQNITYKWMPPILNDCLVMIFFGILKKMTEKWGLSSDKPNLQNDLLCGQGELDSTLPTLTLMKLAKRYDEDSEIRTIFLEKTSIEIMNLLDESFLASVREDIEEFVLNYGFRCSNEQKLEEEDLHTNPKFIFDSLKSYIKMKTYDTSKMHENERKVKDEAEAHVHLILSGLKKKVYLWVLKHARNAVKNRENLRFLRSKSFGLSRRLFRAMANHMYKLGLINQVEDFYFLEYKEVFNFIDGKSTTLNLKDLAILRKTEFERYYAEVDPPDRFLTYGAVGTSLKDMFIINSGDLLKNKIKISDDPNLIYGVSCCPGVVRGKVKIALTVDDAADIEGEILVAKRTDPGWVPLFPSCSGLIVERGSLLSHSAVIARELGLPTIVGVSEDLLSRLKNGDEIELNATNGEIRILNVES